MTAEEIFMAQEHVIMTYSVDDGSEFELKKWTQDQLLEIMWEDKMIYLDSDSCSVKVMNLQGGEDTIIINEINKSGIPCDSLNKVVISEVYDGHIVLKVYDEMNTEIAVYDLNLNNNAIEVLAESRQENQRVPSIIGMWENNYLIEDGFLEVSTPVTAPDGTLAASVQMFGNLALISKEDYWNGRFDNYQQIKNKFLE